MPALTTTGADPLGFFTCPYCRRPVRLDVAVDSPHDHLGPGYASFSYAATLHIRSCPALR